MKINNDTKLGLLVFACVSGGLISVHQEEGWALFSHDKTTDLLAWTAISLIVGGVTAAISVSIASSCFGSSKQGNIRDHQGRRYSALGDEHGTDARDEVIQLAVQASQLCSAGQYELASNKLANIKGVYKQEGAQSFDSIRPVGSLSDVFHPSSNAVIPDLDSTIRAAILYVHGKCNYNNRLTFGADLITDNLDIRDRVYSALQEPQSWSVQAFSASTINLQHAV